MIRCYRGVAVGNPQYAQSLQGVAVPIGGPATPEEHNFGDTRSPYTSWTTDLTVAHQKALDSSLGGRGIILRKDFSERDVVASPDFYGEAEVLVRGVVSGAVVVEVS